MPPRPLTSNSDKVSIIKRIWRFDFRELSLKRKISFLIFFCLVVAVIDAFITLTLIAYLDREVWDDNDYMQDPEIGADYLGNEVLLIIIISYVFISIIIYQFNRRFLKSIFISFVIMIVSLNTSRYFAEDYKIYLRNFSLFDKPLSPSARNCASPTFRKKLGDKCHVQ
jgi:hypothetical protein